MKTKKWLGQHFLTNAGVIKRILDALEAQPTDRFLEIGPGPATLTRPLNERGFGFTVVEYDPDMAAFLSESQFNPPIRIVEGDFMEIPLDDVIEPGIKIVSNLPYNVSVPITARLLSRAQDIPVMVMMYQKEVAERIRAKPKTKAYGIISVLVQAFYDLDIHFNVSPGSFNPPPKVVSQVIRFMRKDKPLFPVKDLEKMTELVRFLFNHRRKTIGSNLKRWNLDWTDKDALIQALMACGLSEKSRPEDLTPGDYAQWFMQIGVKS